MILPSQELCQKAVQELDGDPSLTQWESDFVSSNRWRETFTDAQREVVANLLAKYEI